MWKSIRVAILFASIFTCSSVAAQDKTISLEGTILDSEGNPIPGVNILLKGTTLGAVTDADGNYTLKFPDKFVDREVVASFIGYEAVAKSLAEAKNGQVKKLDFVLSTEVGSLHGWCCTDHKSPDGPHCGDTREELTKDFKCHTFKPDF